MDSKYLSLGKFKVNYIESKFRESILTYIEDIPGTKAIVWDNDLHGPMTLLRFKRRIRELGIEERKLIEGTVPHLKTKNVIFIVRPGATQVDLIADFVHGLSKMDHEHYASAKDYHILFIPRELKMCHRQLQMRGVLGSVNCKAINVQLFPFDGDVLSMEVNHVYRELVVEKDPTTLTNVALALHELNLEYGPFPHILSRGTASVKVLEYFLELQRLNKPCKISVTPTVQHVIILDRQLDLITPLVTQLTYEGLIDEIFGLNDNIATFPGESFTGDQEEMVTSKKIVSLSSAEELYADLRDCNFNAVGPVLRQKAHLVKQQMEKRHDNSVANMRQFVSQLPQLQATKKSLALHTTIAEMIKEKTVESEFLDILQAQQEILCNIDTDKVLTAVEDAIAKNVPILQVLRLICLQSIINGGLKQRVLDHYKKEVIQTYGIKYLMPLVNLERAGLLQPTGGPRNYPALKRTLRLINDADSEVDPTDISFVHSIYAPLSVRLIENFRNWSNMTDILDLVGGPVEEVGSAPPPKPDERQVVLIFFVGGCTYAEISALRFLALRNDSNVEYVIATTKLINGNSLLESVMNS